MANAFDLLVPGDVNGSAPRVQAAIYALSQHYGRATSAVALGQYRKERAAADVGGRLPSLRLAPSPSRAEVDRNVNWALSDLSKIADDHAAQMQDVQDKILAETERVILNAGRDSMIGFVKQDKGALGFRRVAHADACYFCITQSIRRTKGTSENPDGRLGVYKSRESAGQLPAGETAETNRFHTKCRCTVEPVFSADVQLEPYLADAERLYFDSTVNSKPGQSMNDFRRALEATRSGKPVPVLKPDSTPGPQQTPAEALHALFDRLNPAA